MRIYERGHMRAKCCAAVCGAMLMVGAGVDTSRAAYPGTNGKVAFVRMSYGQGGRAIWTAAPDGSGTTLLVADSGGGPTMPAWSADGTRIAYLVSTDGHTSAPNQLVVANADGSGAQTLATAASGQQFTGSPAFTPDGQFLLYAETTPPPSGTGGDQPSAIRKIRAVAGAAPVSLTDGTSRDVDPRPSPDGSKVVFTRGAVGAPGHIEVMAAGGGGITDLSRPASGQNDRLPDWAPDGRSIVFVRQSFDASGTSTHLFTMAADGSTQTDLTPSVPSGGAEDHPVFSPDGTSILYVDEAQSGSVQLKIMNRDGSGARPFGESNPNAYGPGNFAGDVDGSAAWQPAPTSTQPPPPPPPAPKPTASLLSAAFDVYDGVHLPRDVAFGTEMPHYTAGDNVIMTAQCRDLNAMLGGCTLFDLSVASNEIDGYSLANDSYLFFSDRVLANQWTFANPSVGEHTASLLGAYGDAGSVALIGGYVVDPPPQPEMVAAQLQSSAVDVGAQLGPALGSAAGGLPVDAGLSLGNTGSLLDLSSGAGIVSTSGSGLISQDGGGLISQDGGGLISQDGGGLISQDGGGLINMYGGKLSDRGGAASAKAAVAARSTYVAVVDRLGRPVALVVARGGKLWIVATISITHAANGALVLPRTAKVLATGTGTVTSRGIRFRTLRTVGKRQFRLRPGRVMVAVRAPLAGTMRAAVVTAGRHPLTIARGSVVVSVHGQPTTMSLTVSSAGRRSLKRAGRHARFVLVETLTPRIGKRVTVSRAFTVSPRKTSKTAQR